jgi:nucleotidyltransferase substrate binding protein (TIGR01987 family)
MLKRYLEEYSLEKPDGLNNRELFRIGWEQGLISDPEKWFHYLKMRNQTSHVYDKAKAIAVYATTRVFLPDAQYLLKQLKEKAK